MPKRPIKILFCFLSSNTSLAAPGALAQRLQRCTTCNAAPPAKSEMAAALKWLTWSQRSTILGYWALQTIFQNKFVDLSTPSMRKGRNGEWKKWEKNGK